MKYRTKSVTLDAIVYSGSNYDEIREFLGVGSLEMHNDGSFPVQTLEGPLFVKPGYYVVRGLGGEYYGCRPDLFEMKYEPEV